MKRFKDKKILIVGICKTGFKLITFFNSLNCRITVTDLRAIFDLNKQVKKLKKLSSVPEMIFGEYRKESFLQADIIVYSISINPELPQLQLARENGRVVYSEFSLAALLCKAPIIAVCGSLGRTTVAHMIGFILKRDGKKTFVGGTEVKPFIEYAMIEDKKSIDYVIVEVSAIQMKRLKSFHPIIVVFTNIKEKYSKDHFSSITDYMQTKLSLLSCLSSRGILIANYETLLNNIFIKNAKCLTFWYSRRSFVQLGEINHLQGTYFHERRIHSNINYHSEFIVTKMKIIGTENRENLLAAITATKALDASDQAIQSCVEKFPGIPHRLEFIMEKNGVSFYNDSKSEDMETMMKGLKFFKNTVILIAGGKNEDDVDYVKYTQELIENARVLILVGECKEKMNRAVGKHPQTYLVGSFEESILFAYQKSRTGDIILLSPGNKSTDFFRDHEERGNYFKKLVYQL